MRSGRWDVFNGVVFRSEMEAKFARFLHTHGQRWMYEPKIKTSDGVFLNYQIDFYLPDSRLYVEIKPRVFEGELSKMRAMINHFDFEDCQFAVVTEGNVLYRVWDHPLPEMFLDRYEHWWDKRLCELFWGKCRECESLMACGGGLWKCYGCGWYGGDSCMVEGLSYIR